MSPAVIIAIAVAAIVVLAAIVLLTDGRRTTGIDTLEAAKLAADRGVRIHVVGLGNPNGGSYGDEGMAMYLQLDEPTLREVARCTKDGIVINTFMLDATSYLKAFIEKVAEMNRGRAFFTTPETLGDYVLVDFIEHKRSLARGSGARRAS